MTYFDRFHSSQCSIFKKDKRVSDIIRVLKR